MRRALRGEPAAVWARRRVLEVALARELPGLAALCGPGGLAQVPARVAAQWAYVVRQIREREREEAERAERQARRARRRAR